MWLIHVRSYKLKYFQDASQVAQKYAILSHRWEDGEVSHSDMTSHWDRLRLKRLKGWHKIQKCCEQAAADKLAYAWVDTCCIDKTSSAELQEATISLFKWYSEAMVCYVFLSDVRFTDLPKPGNGLNDPSMLELLAPKELIFYDCKWRSIASRIECRDIVSEVIGIETSYLDGFDPSWTINSAVCIAQVMIWASGRKTTRIEDKAYSLLGIFGVSMPMLYGEGTQAFFRLQERLLLTRDDQTIFAWTGLDSQTPMSIALTDTPDDFVRLPPAFHWFHTTELERRRPPIVSSDGIVLEILMYCVRPGEYHALLNTLIVNVDLQHLLTSENSADTTEDGKAIIMMLAIPIKEIGANDHFIRLVKEGQGGLINYAASKRDACKLRSVTLSSFMRRKEYDETIIEDSSSFTIPESALDLWVFSPVSNTIEPPQTWPLPSPERRIVKGENSSAIIGLLTWSGWPHKLEWSNLCLPVSAIAFGYDFDFNPTCIVVTGHITYDMVGFKQLHSIFEDDVNGLHQDQVDVFGTKFTVVGAPLGRGQSDLPELLVFKTTKSTRRSGSGFRAVIPLANGIYGHYHKAKLRIRVSRESKETLWEINIDLERHATQIISHAIAPKLTRFVQPRPAYRLGIWAENGGGPWTNSSTVSALANHQDSDSD